ncbi:MAG: SUMF1/EgtB/PvdO family nonheme iron enzyme [Gemmatimonadaceae bacterium]|nr:SUMF1/EgtB/PvdO family nonheme iron enzyme [Gemmatimonadaceae bacterium]
MINLRVPASFAVSLLLASAGVPAVAPSSASAQSATTTRVVDSLPGLRLRWELVPVPGGEVTVPGANGPTRVRVESFLIGVTEVPWELFDVFYLRLDVPRDERTRVDAAARPSRPYGAPDRGFGHRGWPAISLTHGAAMRFAVWLSEKTGHRYAVATDAQWQRAADLAAAQTTSLRDVAWHAANADGTTHAIGTMGADQLGLHDLFGNAGEWVTGQDGTPWLRGGSFMTASDSLSPTTRERQQSSWNSTDPQDPKSRWWLSDGPFAGVRLVRIP